MTEMNFRRLAAVAVGLTMAAAGQAVAMATFTGTGSGFGSGGSKSATVTFDVSGSNLIVTVTNSATSDVLVPADVLTGMAFDVTGGPIALTRVSGLLAAASTVVYDPDGQPAGGVIGGEWAYMSGLVGLPNGASYGISSAGLGLFGPGDLFPGPDLAAPTSPDGLQYGLLSAGDNTATGNGGITGSGGLIRSSVVFTLSGLPANFDLGRITNVFAIYGTAIGEGGFQIPAPGSAVMLGLAGAMLARRRRSSR